MKYILSVCLSCLFLSNTWAQTLDTEAHRGGRGLRPENTVPSMLNGLKIGARTLELDCYITSDGKVVVSHDPTIASNIMVNPDGSEITPEQQKTLILHKMTYADIKKYPERLKRHADFPEQQLVKAYKPLLSELIDSVETYIKVHHLKPVDYNIETKSKPGFDGVYQPAPDVFVHTLMDVIKQKGITNRVIIQSFDPRTLQVLHKEMPYVRTDWLVSKGDYDTIIKKLGFKPSMIGVMYKNVTKELVDKAHADGVKVIPWTPETEDEFKALQAMGVDGIVSDYPDRMVKVFGSYQK